MPTIIYRIEHTEHRTTTREGHTFPTGVFTSTDDSRQNTIRWDAVRQARALGATHPHPPTDGLPRWRIPEYVFGFRSMSQLTSWFPVETWESLSRAGFVVREYVCPSGTTRRGKSQVMFLFSAAKARRTTVLG